MILANEDLTNNFEQIVLVLVQGRQTATKIVNIVLLKVNAIFDRTIVDLVKDVFLKPNYHKVKLNMMVSVAFVDRFLVVTAIHYLSKTGIKSDTCITAMVCKEEISEVEETDIEGKIGNKDT